MEMLHYNDWAGRDAVGAVADRDGRGSRRWWLAWSPRRRPRAAATRPRRSQRVTVDLTLVVMRDRQP